MCTQGAIGKRSLIKCAKRLHGLRRCGIKVFHVGKMFHIIHVIISLGILFTIQTHPGVAATVATTMGRNFSCDIDHVCPFMPGHSQQSRVFNTHAIQIQPSAHHAKHRL
ncbi:hypothetical protein TKWG_15960 [Advenella kashmirensis WT001]|uniref:Uncharacterized protein n=1 Tax=Advenella kashmirensis (strain DSM 17095 / LMG 22695 / WT001) TaxID=1036672 RepID=I3UDS9_ADVKW|nr:hypothetical protein TKWG_15960 [Advenella kashmirensis WT001]